MLGENRINLRNLVLLAVREELEGRCFDFVEFWDGHTEVRSRLITLWKAL
jgi:hypothetical protein